MDSNLLKLGVVENAFRRLDLLRLVRNAGIDKVAKEDPARACDMLMKLAEFCTPKLARAELANADTGELVVRVVRE